jgi:hypothetical protein
MCAGRRSGAGAFTQSVSSVSLPVDVLHVSDTNRSVDIFAVQAGSLYRGHAWISQRGWFAFRWALRIGQQASALVVFKYDRQQLKRYVAAPWSALDMLSGVNVFDDRAEHDVAPLAELLPQSVLNQRRHSYIRVV